VPNAREVISNQYHVLLKEDTDWVKKCMEYEVDGSRPRGRPEDMERGCAKRFPST